MWRQLKLSLPWLFSFQLWLGACLVAKRDSVPAYVLDYAPLVYLYSGDPYLPSDIGAQIANTRPEDNFQVVTGAQLDVNNLDQLNALDGSNVYLTSIDDITTNPTWLKGVKPDSTGKVNGAVPCAIITTDHGNGLVDAFYMYFYAYNWGGLVLDIPALNFDDHVGDWEHNMIRFQDGTPTAVWFSQHSNGEAFTYDAVQKTGMRPIVYSANGSHANYATTGPHEHTIPDLNLPIDGILTDQTDAGILWDPTLSAYFYSYSNATGNPVFTASDDSSPLGWINFIGRWGDEQYPDSDPRQFVLFGQPKYASGPTGPFDKQLNRTNVCPDNGDLCILRTVIGAK